MPYKAIKNPNTYRSRPKTEHIRMADSWESGVIGTVSKLIVSIFLLAMLTGLFADPLVPPTIIGSVYLNYHPADVVYTRIRLYNANNDIQAAEVYPDTDGSFSFSTDAGQYYLVIEMFRPDLAKFTYPIKTQVINIPNTSYLADLGTIQMNQYNMSSVKVSANPAHPYFKSIDQALVKIFSAVNGGYNGNSAMLHLFQDEYELSSLNFSYTSSANNALNLNIVGLGTNGVSIEPEENHISITAHRVNTTFSNIRFMNELNIDDDCLLFFNPSTNAKYSFNNCHFGKTEYNYRFGCVSFNGLSGLSFYNCQFQYINNSDTYNTYATTGHGSVKFIDCSDINIDTSVFAYNRAFGGGAIYLENCDDVNISSCQFNYNTALQGTDGSIVWGHPGGAIYAKNSSEIKILDNQFCNNTTTGSGGAVYLELSSQFDISGNLFKDNKVNHVRLSGSQSDALGFENCAFTTNDTISHNIIHSGLETSPISPSDFIAIGGNCSGTLKLANGLFIKGNLDTNYNKKIITSFSPVNLNFVNSVFLTRDVDADFYVYPPQSSTISVTYSLFDNEITGATTELHNTYNVGNLALDSNYAPVWNQTTMSPCIDSGNPNSPRDPDGSPADIGAIRAIDHGYWQYRFRSGESERGDTYHWVSYPIVNSLTQGKTVARSFFHELLGTHYTPSGQQVADVLQEILWSAGNLEKKILWTEGDWGDYVDSLNVVSPQGFKIKLLPPDGLNPTTVELHHSGFLTPANTPFMIYGSNSNGGQTYENWIGYFDTESSWPDDAFSSIWDDITMIKARDWCLYRNPDTGMGGTIGTMLPINCGDMVIVTTRNDHEFQWDTTNPTDPIKKKVPIAFNYVEMADYTPVYLDLSGTDITDLQEIGLKLDGVCKGAVVVTDTLEQICAYLDEGESLNSGLVELEFFYESKSQPQEMRRLAINDKQLSGSFIGGDPAYPVYNIKVSTEEPGSTVVPVLSLEQNYPNPFNPTTTIRYSIDEQGPVSLDIFNIKGQLVKSLYRGTGEVGSHSAIWDGLDKSGNACSSGVYFYRLKTKKSNLIRKMLMLK